MFFFFMFTDVKAVVFVLSLACYNELMFEDETKNYMEDAIQLFDKTINNEHFLSTPIILFLNKSGCFYSIQFYLTYTNNNNNRFI